MLQAQNKSDQSSDSVGISKTPAAPAPLIQMVSNEFNDLNERQYKLISEIQERLHSIIDKRSKVQDDKDQVSPPTLNDFSTAMSSNLYYLRMNTNKLNDILCHLQEIT